MKPPKLDHVKYVRAKGHLYAYFNTGRKENGRTIYVPLPKPGSIGFFDSYAACLAGRKRKTDRAYTVERLCDDYQDSREFAALSQGTQGAYGVYLRLAVSLLGKATVDDVKRGDIEYILDKENWGAGKRNLFVAVIGAAYKWGRAKGKTASWPTREMRQADTGEYEPWPDSVLEAGLTAEDDRVRLAVALLFYTGQRIGDVCAMRWTNIKAGSIRIVQQKTSKALVIPMHRDLLAELTGTGKRGMTLLANAHGGPLTTDTLRKNLKAFCAEMGHPELRPHGLRKNAVIAMLEQECSVAETAAVTGQTYQLVEYYARRIDQKRMAKAAILKLERRGNVQTLENHSAERAENRGRD